MVGRYCFGLCGAAGITISFQPNKRASREKTPGPRKAIATKPAVTWNIISLESSKFPGREVPKTATLTHSRAARRLKIGVSSPSKMNRPVTTSKTPAASSPAFACERDRRHANPSAANVEPVAARKIKSPIPGGPPGNAENNLCRVHLPSNDKYFTATINGEISRRFPTFRYLTVTLSRYGTESNGIVYRWIMPRRMAIATACVRSLAPSFSMMCLT
jgi:hypothetical protein